MKWFYFREMVESDIDDEFMHCCDQSSKDWQLVMDYQKEGAMFLQYLGDLTSVDDVRKFLTEEGYREINDTLKPMV